mgnify:CR=1 FL=1
MAPEKPESKAKSYFTTHASFYTSSPAHTDESNLLRIKELAQAQPHWMMLDIATGTGHTASAFSPQVKSVVALDLTPAMMEEGRGNIVVSDSIYWACGDAHALPFAENTFDAVSCRRAYHHFSDPGHALHEIRRVLKPGGRFILDDRSVPEDEEVDRFMNQLDLWHDPSHVRQYPLSDWRKMLSDAGFRVDHLEGYTRKRPLSALTTTAAPEDAVKIESTMERISPHLKAVLKVEKQEDEIFHRHWYVVGIAVLT